MLYLCKIEKRKLDFPIFFFLDDKIVIYMNEFGDMFPGTVPENGQIFERFGDCPEHVTYHQQITI